VDGLILGTHNFTIVISDSSGNIASHTVFVHVDDTTSPVITNSPTDFTYEYGSSSNELSWTATDSHPYQYYLYQNGTQIIISDWISGTPITSNVDSLNLGTHNFTIVIYDSSGNIAFHTVFVNVEDTTPPVFTNTPADFAYEFGTSDNQITWTVTDHQPYQFFIFRNGSQIRMGTWDSGIQIIQNIDGLTLGNYNFTIIVYDSEGNKATNTVFVTVEDTIAPILIIIPSDFTYEHNTTGHDISWNATDSHSHILFIYQNGSLMDTFAWTSGSLITINVDSLDLGTYNYTIVFTDTEGNQAVHSVFVTVVDTTPPVFTVTSTDFTYQYGSTGNQLTWTMNDNHPDNYIIYRNGLEISSNYWANGEIISLNVDGLELGSYNFTILVTDTEGNYVTHTTTVSVVMDPAQPPIFTEVPGNYTFEHGTSEHNIEWVATDDDASTYQIHINGSQIASGSWNVNITIVFDISNLNFGIHNITIILYDLAGNSASHAVFVDVIDTTAPNFMNTDENQTIEYGTVNNEIFWTIYDTNPSHYIIYQNGLQIEFNDWIDMEEGIFLNIDGLVVNATHNFTIIIFDAAGNSNTHSIYISVVDTTSPELLFSTEDFSYEVGSTGQSITWEFFDLSADSYYIYLNGDLIQQDLWITNTLITLYFDGLDVGTHNISILVYDLFNNYNSHTVFVTVDQDTTPPMLQEYILLYSYEYGSTGNTLTWRVIDTNPDIYIIYINGIFVKEGEWAFNQTVYINIDGLNLGSHNITALFIDIYGNNASNMVEVHVIDTVKPVFTNTPENFEYVVGNTGNQLSWIVTDTFPNDYTIHRNGVLIDSGIWTSGNQISLGVDGLNVGIYNFTILVFDTSGNNASHSVFVTVINIETDGTSDENTDIETTPTESTTEDDPTTDEVTTQEEPSGPVLPALPLSYSFIWTIMALGLIMVTYFSRRNFKN
jgi:large repetitive protein